MKARWPGIVLLFLILGILFYFGGFVAVGWCLGIMALVWLFCYMINCSERDGW